MINRVTLVGRLTKDPETRYTTNGIATCQFTVAVNRTFTNQAGEREADFVPCIAWRKQAENLANYMHKGALIGVDGRLQTRTYEVQDGSKRFVMEVVADSIQFLESKKQDDQYGNQVTQSGYKPTGQGIVAPPTQPQQAVYSSEQADNFAIQQPGIEISDDDLPF
ncbi:MAG: single-stranded DNA-binding protein [Bacilli bacterium]